MKFAFFDLDGTLADTDPDIRGAWKASIVDEGLECPCFDRVFFAGPPFDEMTALLFPDHPDTTALAERLRQRFATHYDYDGFPLTREYSGVIDAVRELKRRGVKPYIVTNKRHAGTLAMVRHFGWDKIFEGAYSTDMYRETLGVLKKGALLKRVMSELGAAPDNSVMIGDTTRDFEAANFVGIRSIGVTWGYGTTEELTAATIQISLPNELGCIGIFGARPHQTE